MDFNKNKIVASDQGYVFTPACSVCLKLTGTKWKLMKANGLRFSKHSTGFCAIHIREKVQNEKRLFVKKVIHLY